MSKPLCFFLELVGGGLLFVGIASSNTGMIAIGGLMFIWGAWGIRKRLKKD